MPAYLLVEEKSLTPPLPEGKGIPANSQKIGFLDFLRDLEKDEFPYNENSRLMIVGIEETLLAASPDIHTAAIQIRNLLQKAANRLSNCNCSDIQIVFRHTLQHGYQLMVKHVSKEIPIHLIFGTPTQEEINGEKVYRPSFNRSSN